MATTKTVLRILQVDDRGRAKAEVGGQLDLLGVAHEIIFVEPDPDSGDKFDIALPDVSELELLDLALVDLELFKKKTPATVVPEDLAGGHVVLPRLRQLCPWVPVIGYSALFEPRNAESFLPVAGGFGFDAHLPWLFFFSDNWTQKLWRTVLERAKELRMRSLLGPEYSRTATPPAIETSRIVEQSLLKATPQWRDLAAACFHFAGKIAISEIEPGFSGAWTFRVITEPREIGVGGKGTWFWKLSSSPSKLHVEAMRHQDMVRAGLGFARAAQLLWPGALVLQGVACIAYQFVDGTKTAAASVASGAALTTVAVSLAKAVQSFHGDAHSSSIAVGKLLTEWFGEGTTMAVVAQGIGTATGNELAEIVRGSGQAAEVWICRIARIHGDLHMRNVMLDGDEQAILVDFARARSGPVVLDLATVAADMLVRYAELREGLPTFKGSTSKLEIILQPLWKTTSWAADDARMFTILLRVLLLRAIEFKDTSDDTRLWIRTVI